MEHRRTGFNATVQLVSLAAIAAALAGCKTFYEDAPAATTPTLGRLEAVLDPHGPFIVVPPTAGSFEVLPSGLPSSGIRVYIYAPYPAKLRVDIDGTTQLVDSKEAPAGTDLASTGYFRVDDVNVSYNPAIWMLGIRPPNSLATSSGYTVNLTHVSLNPNYKDSQGNPQASAPLPLRLASQRKFLLNISFRGTGHGRVTGPGNVINCVTDCTVGPFTDPSINLAANSDQDSTFAGWGGVCSTSTGSSCVVVNTNTFTAMNIVATFTATGTSSTNLTGCPSIEPQPAGYSYFNQPKCDRRTHLDAALMCDAQGYFCCYELMGAPAGSCRVPDRANFPADCMYDNTNVQLFPAGCFIKH